MLCSRTDGQGRRSAHGICAALAGRLLSGACAVNRPVGVKQCNLPMIAILSCQRSIVPLHGKGFCSSHIKLCFANSCSCLLLCSRKTGLAVRDSGFVAGPHHTLALCGASGARSQCDPATPARSEWPLGQPRGLEQKAADRVLAL